VLVALAIPPEFDLPDALWIRVSALLPRPLRSARGGRPRADDRRCLAGIVYLLRTGIQWGALPRCFGPKSTVHDRFQAWATAGLFQQLWSSALLVYDTQTGVRWAWQAMDGTMTKAPLGGERTGPNPTDRGKSGVKRSLLTDGRGVPLAVVAAPANRNDCKLVEGTLDARQIRPPRSVRQRLCLDRGYDFPEVDELVEAYRFEGHIARRGPDLPPRRERLASRPRRWVVERTHSWMNRFRRILVRWEKKVANYLAMLHLACGWITMRAARLL
jgi:putative transposase